MVLSPFGCAWFDPEKRDHLSTHHRELALGGSCKAFSILKLLLRSGLMGLTEFQQDKGPGPRMLLACAINPTWKTPSRFPKLMGLRPDQSPHLRSVWENSVTPYIFKKVCDCRIYFVIQVYWFVLYCSSNVNQSQCLKVWFGLFKASIFLDAWEWPIRD